MAQYRIDSFFSPRRLDKRGLRKTAARAGPHGQFNWLTKTQASEAGTLFGSTQQTKSFNWPPYESVPADDTLGIWLKATNEIMPGRGAAADVPRREEKKRRRNKRQERMRAPSKGIHSSAGHVSSQHRTWHEGPQLSQERLSVNLGESMAVQNCLSSRVQRLEAAASVLVKGAHAVAHCLEHAGGENRVLPARCC